MLLRISHFPAIGHLKLVRMMREGKFDAVCDFAGDFAGLPLLVALLSRIKTRIAFYRESRHQFKASIPKLLYAGLLNRITASAATSILSNSREALDRFHPHWQTRLDLYRVVQNGVPPPTAQVAGIVSRKRQELGVPPENFLVGHTGRFTPAKNHEQIVRVAAEVIRRNDRFRFLLCGRGVKDHLQSSVEARGIADKFVLFNSRDDIPEILPCLDAFYFPSLNEGMPNSLIEAWTYGTPFVASNIAPVATLLPQQYQRYLLDPNDVSGAADALLELANGASFPSKQLQSWAISEFDQNKKFEEFLAELGA